MKKTVLITGSSKGLGKSLAKTFAENGYNLIIHGRDLSALEKVRKEVSIYRVDCEVICGDLADGLCELTIQKLQSSAHRRSIDIFINNAGTHLNKPFHECSAKEISGIINTNLLAPILTMQKIYSFFIKKKSGLIVNINSLAGKSGAFGETVYCASKHGLRGFSRALQFEATKYNVRIVDIFLGRMQTDINKGKENFKKYIKPKEAADLIFRVCQSYPSMRTTEIELLRGIY
jgi:short-subunit dehydrogenase